MSDNSKPLWENFTELLKIELSTVAFLYVVLGFFVSAISGQNTLHFSLAQGSLPKQFVPYAPIFDKIFWFTVINILWTSIAFVGGFWEGATDKIKKTLSMINAATFILSIIYFANIIYTFKRAFLFIK